MNRSEGCPKCGGEVFHRFGCPYVLWPVSGAALVVGAVIAVIQTTGRDEGFDVRGLIGVLILYLLVVLVWFVLGKARRDR